MAFNYPVKMEDGTTYTVKNLLAKRKDANTKIAKSNAAGMDVVTHSLSLAAASESGFNLCASSSAGCRASCIYTSGFAGIFRSVHPSRIAKSRLLRLDPTAFIDRLRKEIGDSVKHTSRKGVKLAIRLNVFSDVMWEKEFKGFMEDFPTVQFYDYTKHYTRMMRHVKGELPENYQLTFSRSEKNWEKCVKVLEAGRNVAVAFNIKYHGKNLKPLPAEYMGYSVVDGDLTDLRFLDDQAGNIVGLRAKGKGRNEVSGFVVK